MFDQTAFTDCSLLAIKGTSKDDQPKTKKGRDGCRFIEQISRLTSSSKPVCSKSESNYKDLPSLCSFLPGWSSFWCTHCRVKEAFSNHCKSIYSLIFFTKLRSTWGEAGKMSSDAIMSCFLPPVFFLCSLGDFCHLCYYTITQLLHY